MGPALIRAMAIALLLWLVMWPAPAHAQGARPTGLRFMDDVAYQSIPLAVPPLLGQVPKAGTHDPRRLQRRPGLKVMNSWGTQWGNRGFGWISYGCSARPFARRT